MNISDSERIAAVLEKNNFKPAENINEAGLVIFNTCGVRQMAEDRVYGQIHNSRIKNKDLRFKIILTGCLANRPDVKKRLRDKVDLFVDIKNFQQEIKKIFNSYFLIRNSFHGSGLNHYLKIKPKYATRFSAGVPIMTGCDNFCAYCVVPHARGREISRPEEEIIKEVKNLVKNGYKHIILLGQNVNSYEDKIKRGPTSLGRLGRERSDLYKTINFSALLQKINSIPGHFWISFISNHPKDVTDEMIKTVAQCKKVCEYFHLPLQSGNDGI